MPMKSFYIVYITNCFLWNMADNKADLILSYLIDLSEELYRKIQHQRVISLQG